MLKQVVSIATSELDLIIFEAPKDSGRSYRSSVTCSPPPSPKKKNCSILSPNNNGISQAVPYKVNSTRYPKLNFQYMKNEENFLNIITKHVKNFQAF